MTFTDSFRGELIKIESNAKYDSIFLKIPIKNIHSSISDKEDLLRAAEQDGRINVSALQAAFQEYFDSGRLEITL